MSVGIILASYGQRRCETAHIREPELRRPLPRHQRGDEPAGPGKRTFRQQPQENRRQAVELAHQALQADGDDPTVLAEAARVLAYFIEDIDCAIAMI